MRRCLGLMLLTGLMLAFPVTAADKDVAKAKESLQKLNDFIGSWKGDGSAKVGTKEDNWKEKMAWGWKFKGEDSWIHIDFTDSKNFTVGDLKYDTEKKLYILTLTTPAKEEVVYEGDLVKKILVLKNVDSETKDVKELKLSTNNDGARLIMESTVQVKGKGIAKKLYTVAAGKEGVSLSGGKKTECIVTGGLGTMPVSFGGKTYYVCCSGCRDAFNDNPKKFIDEFEAKSKK